MSDEKQSKHEVSLAKVEEVMRRFMAGIRHSEMLGIDLVKITDNGLIMKLPYSKDIVGNPETGVIHGGPITTLMDQTCGMAAVRAIVPDFDIVPTIDLRIDYMRAAEPHREVFALAECYRKTKSVIFTRGIAYQDSPEKPIASCVATFMRMGLGKAFLQSQEKLREQQLSNQQNSQQQQ